MENLYRNGFKKYLVISLVIIGVVVSFIGQSKVATSLKNGPKVHFFCLPGCPHCEAQEPFNERIGISYYSIKIIYHNSSELEGSALIREWLRELE